ncbi:MAG: rhodanese-like domain-containing protein [Nitriliruptorales bacterium]|nr:rhodanese-like domain-containing protein [Nitriliruptorales bacterium]
MRTLRIALLVLLLLGGLLGCDAGNDPSSSGDGSASQSIVAQAEGRTWIDVRTPAEYADAHLLGAVNIDLQSADFRQRIAELPRDGSYLVYCRSGNRSATAAGIMSELGFTDVVDGGGFAALVAAGLPEA